MDNFDNLTEAFRVQLSLIHGIEDKSKSTEANSSLTFVLVRMMAMVAYSSLNDAGINNLANELKDLFLDQVAEVGALSEQIMKNLTNPTEH